MIPAFQDITHVLIQRDLLNGMNPNKVENGVPILFEMVYMTIQYGGSWKSVKMLLDAGADPNLTAYFEPDEEPEQEDMSGKNSYDLLERRFTMPIFVCERNSFLAKFVRSRKFPTDVLNYIGDFVCVGCKDGRCTRRKRLDILINRLVDEEEQ